MQELKALQGSNASWLCCSRCVEEVSLMPPACLRSPPFSQMTLSQISFFLAGHSLSLPLSFNTL